MNPQPTWCILRCAGSRTLDLAAGLAAEGFQTWTPSEMKRNRRPRNQKPGPEPVPIMPTFVFAGAGHLWTLVVRSEKPNSDFSVFRHIDRFPIIADVDLQGLRDAEKEAIPKADRPAYGKGEDVVATDGPYSGLPGKVLRCRGGDALVLFGWQKVKISTFILRSDMPDRLQAATDLAA
jgi:hypothetical protein